MAKTKYTTVTVPKEVYEKLKEYCNRHGYSISKLICNMILEKIDDPKKKEK